MTYEEYSLEKMQLAHDERAVKPTMWVAVNITLAVIYALLAIADSIREFETRQRMTELFPDSNPQSISRLRGRHRDQTVWIVASGATLDHVPPDFFADKVTVGVNATHNDWPVTYLFAHHREDAQAALYRGFQVITSDYDCGRTENGRNILHGSYYTYHHPEQPPVLQMNMRPLEDDDYDSLIIGSNTVTSAMDLVGRIFQAKAIILCGVDGGSLDGHLNYRDYNPSSPKDLGWEQVTPGGTGWPHLIAQYTLLLTVTQALRRRGVAVMSLNPFVDLKLEGHEFRIKPERGPNG